MSEALGTSYLERSEPSTGSFSHNGGRKLFLEEAGNSAPSWLRNCLPEKAGLEIRKPGHSVFVLHL